MRQHPAWHAIKHTAVVSKGLVHFYGNAAQKKGVQYNRNNGTIIL